METLTVYLNDRQVAWLTDDNGAMSLSYLPAYAADLRNEPLSRTLPLRLESYGHQEIEPFLSGLLPDDIIRTRLGRILQIPRENTFAFLKAIGGECAGAIAFFAEGEAPVQANGRFRRLSDAEASAILDSLEKRPLDVGEDGFRISGAGAQDKLIACWRRGTVFLPLDGTPSTHIIKTAILDYPDSVENECFSMKLAGACGLSVARCRIAVLGGKRRYVCERYDRTEADGVVRRLHQEDFCQLLRVDPKRKYEVLGGPGIAESVRLMREMSLTAADTLEFLRRLVFNFLIGNGDAHGKNFSVLYHGRKAALSPMYDVMSTVVYPDVSPRMAMKVDGEYAFKWMTRGKFLRQAEKLGFAPRTMNKEIDRMVKRIARQAPSVAARLSARFPCDCYARIIDGISARSRQLGTMALAMLAGVCACTVEGGLTCC